MRFTEAGPSIPNDLLDSRDAGDVVFLCGAGISIPAGLPDFFKLTVDVARRLGVQPDSQAGRLMEAERQNRLAGRRTALRDTVSFDRIFTLLVRAFGIGQVEAEVVAVLSSGRRPHLGHHRALLDLARGPDGRQRLITTNFDRLFQKAQPRLRSYTAPHFPDLSRRDGFDGVVHLHGMLPAAAVRRSSEPLGLVLSSGDFGRAYLADAWATRFICDLLDRQIVVLLGYSADDPPVRYLLEGLNLSGRIGERRLYAFAAGDGVVVEGEWRERGVTAITYDPVDNHRHLWESIDSWAERARDPVAWRNRVVSLARTPPERLRSFERGQVVALCSSNEGALAFASATPPPPAEWLCVFDAVCRYWKPGRSISYNEAPALEIDPLQAYGLDDDPPRRQEGDRNQAPPGTDLLAALKSDDPVARESGVINWHRSSGPLNARLFQMTRWIQSVMSSATAVWWAASRGPLHDQLYRQLCWTLDRDDSTLDPVVRQAWRLALESHDSLPDSLREGWYGVQAQIRKEGWTTRSLRVLADATRPRISAQRPWSHAPVPPEEGGEPLALSRIAHFDVIYPKLIENNAAVPDASIAAVLEVIRQNLERGGVLEQEISQIPSRLPTLYPEHKRGEHHYSDSEEYYVIFARLFRRLVAFDPTAAGREFRTWGSQARFFVPLRIWALADSNIASATEVGRALRALDRDTFWNPNHGRELLWTLRARWNTLLDRDRRALEVKIIEGRAKYTFETEAEYGERRASLSAARLIWMRDAGLKLNAGTRSRLPKLKKANPHWRDTWAKTADESHESRTGWVQQETDPAPIAGLPLSKVIARCDDLGQREFASFTDRDPFRGLIEAAPHRAMAVLAYEARRGNFPQRYWSSLLSHWPKDAPSRRVVALAKILSSLSSDVLIGIRYEVTRWVGGHYATLDRLDLRTAHRCFDQVVEALESGSVELLKSGRGTSSIGGVEIPSNRMGVDYAINAPSGDLAQGIIDALFARKPRRKQHLAKDLRIRLERLLALPEEGGWHALTVIAQQMHGLYVIDGGWTRNVLLPRFNPEQAPAEAAWSGFLGAARLASPSLFSDMKADFLKAIAATPRWTADGLSHLGEHLVLALERFPRRKALLTFDEGRSALRAASGEVRQRALYFLRSRVMVEGAWDGSVVPFFRNVWPRERQFQTVETTRTLVLFLEELGERFPDGVSLVADFLTPSPNAETFVFQFGNDREHGHVDLTARYPLDTLFLLSKIIDETSERPPYGLAEVLSHLANAAPDLRHDERWQKLHRLTFV
jgi:hypothetical protein